MKIISSDEAAQTFAHLLEAVAAGETIVIEAEGAPVAFLSPPDDRRLPAEDARTALLRRLDAQATAPLPAWSRSDLYDRTP